MYYVQFVNMFFLNVFVQACALQIKKKLNRKIHFHLDTTEGFERDMHTALMELREFNNKIDISFSTHPTRKLFKNRTKRERRRLRKIQDLINELQDANKGTFTLKPTKYKIVTKEIQKLEKIKQFLENVRYYLVGYFHNHGFDLSNIDDAIFAIQDYIKELGDYVYFIRDCPEKAILPPKLSYEALLVVKEVFVIIGKIGNRKEERNEAYHEDGQQSILCAG